MHLRGNTVRLLLSNFNWPKSRKDKWRSCSRLRLKRKVRKEPLVTLSIISLVATFSSQLQTITKKFRVFSYNRIGVRPRIR